MFFPCQHCLLRISAGAALAGGSVVAGNPATVPLPDISLSGIQLAAGAEQITLDLVRSGQDARPEPVITATVPGPPLTDTGHQQAHHVADLLAQDGPYAGIYAGQQIRMSQTAAPLADLLGLHTQVLPGLNGIDAGIYQGLPIASPGGILFALSSAAWIFGLEFVPIPASKDANGVAFTDRFNDAIQTIYDNTVSASGPSTNVAFSADQAITTWVMMNVNNPDFSILLPLLLKAVQSGNPENILPPTGDIVVRGDPEDGWTLVSWDGTPFPQNPGLPTELFVDFRDLIVAPQTALWHIWQAIISGDPATILPAIQTGLDDVGATITQFPGSVIQDILGAVQSLGTDTDGAAAFSDAVGSVF